MLESVIAVVRRNLVGTIMVAVLAMFSLTCPNFFTVGNFLDILKQGGILCLVALAMTMVLIVGGMDMSVGAMTDMCTNVCAGMLLVGYSPAVALVASMGAGVGMGLFNALMTVVVGIPAFIATVGTMFVVTGLIFAYNQGQSFLLRDQPFFFSLAQGSTWGIPNLALIVAVATALIFIFVRRVRFGTYLYAVGGNAMAARTAGIGLAAPRVTAYALSGALSGVAGILASSYISGSFALGSSFEFLITAFAAAFLGSTLIRQGELNPLGTVIAALFITALTNAITLYGVSHLLLPAFSGIVLIIALVLGNWGKKEIGQMTIF